MTNMPKEYRVKAHPRRLPSGHFTSVKSHARGMSLKRGDRNRTRAGGMSERDEFVFARLVKHSPDRHRWFVAKSKITELDAPDRASVAKAERAGLLVPASKFFGAANGEHLYVTSEGQAVYHLVMD